MGIEPTYKGFADLSLTTWVPRLGSTVYRNRTGLSARKLAGVTVRPTGAEIQLRSAFEPALRDLRVNHAAARFNGCAARTASALVLVPFG